MISKLAKYSAVKLKNIGINVHWNMVMQHSYVSVPLLSSALTPLFPTVGKQPGLLSCIEEAHTPYDLCRNILATISIASITSNTPCTNSCLYTAL